MRDIDDLIANRDRKELDRLDRQEMELESKIDELEERLSESLDLGSLVNYLEEETDFTYEDIQLITEYLTVKVRRKV